MTNIVAIAM